MSLYCVSATSTSLIVVSYLRLFYGRSFILIFQYFLSIVSLPVVVILVPVGGGELLLFSYLGHYSY